jgi:hypothetical protein
MNLNDQELAIDAGKNYRIPGIPQKDFFLWIVHFKDEFQISRILLRPINRAGLLVEAACIKPTITSYSRHEGAK